MNFRLVESALLGRIAAKRRETAPSRDRIGSKKYITPLKAWRTSSLLEPTPKSSYEYPRNEKPNPYKKETRSEIDDQIEPHVDL